MSEECIIIGSDLGLYREVLAGTLGALRPHLRIHAVAPDRHGDVCPCSAPRLVICNDPQLIDRLRPTAWILLYSGDRDVARIAVGDTIRTMANATMDDLLAVVDEVSPAPHSFPSSSSACQPSRG